MKFIGSALATVVALATVNLAQADGTDVGDAAPQFEATADDGSKWKAAEHYDGKTVVFFFFPAAMTGG